MVITIASTLHTQEVYWKHLQLVLRHLEQLQDILVFEKCLFFSDVQNLQKFQETESVELVDFQANSLLLS
jgi:hypothetical protein